MWADEYGVNAAARGTPGRMLDEQRRAHERLASLPRRVYSRSEAEAREKAEAAKETREKLARARMRNSGVYNASAVSPLFGQATTTLRKSPSKSNPQREQILAALRKGPMTADEIRQRFDCLRPSARISEIRELGHYVAVESVPVDGRMVRRYVLRVAAE